MKQSKWSGGKIAALIFGCMAGAVLLVVAFSVDMYRFYKMMEDTEQVAHEENIWEEAENENPEDDLKESEEDAYDWMDELRKEKDDSENNTSRDEEKISEDDAYWEGIEYYQFTDYIREDLSYQVKLESLETEGDNTYIDANYPVLSGNDVPNLEGINRAIQNELTVVEDYVEEIGEQLAEGETFEFLIDGYVTYMSEDIFSVAFVEYGYLNEEFYESYVVSVNIDMTTGMVMDNTQILDIDDEFSIDFRERSEKQNGSIYDLSVYSDQEITEYLNDSEHAIILYTPLGMEVGINYFGGWVTVTYSDYTEFLKQL